MLMTKILMNIFVACEDGNVGKFALIDRFLLREGKFCVPRTFLLVKN